MKSLPPETKKNFAAGAQQRSLSPKLNNILFKWYNIINHGTIRRYNQFIESNYDVY